MRSEPEVAPGVEQQRRASFNFGRKSFIAEAGRRIRQTVTVSASYQIQQTKLFDVREVAPSDQLLIDRLFPQVRLSKFSGGVLRDSRDDVLDPQRGAVVGLDTSVAAKTFGSEVGFVKSFAQGFIYRRVPGRGWVLAAGARLGVAVGFSQEVDPVLEIARPANGLPPDFAKASSRQAMTGLTRAIDRAERGADSALRGNRVTASFRARLRIDPNIAYAARYTDPDRVADGRGASLRITTCRQPCLHAYTSPAPIHRMLPALRSDSRRQLNRQTLVGNASACLARPADQSPRG